MSELCEFLLARIAEDLTVAQHDLSEAMTYEGLAPGVTSNLRRERRRLAECEAKRRIVELWVEQWDEWHGFGSGLTRTRMTDDQYALVLTAERVLGLLALPYADHPDFREEWTCI